MSATDTNHDLPAAVTDVLNEPTTERAGTISQLFATPVARIPHPHAERFNGTLAEVLLARSAAVENRFAYKTETTSDLASWNEPIINKLSAWMLAAARRYVETAIGADLNTALRESNYNTETDQRHPHRVVNLAIGTSWASIYRKGDRHEPHFHPNTAITAIYYVKAPGTCELDLADPRPHISYFDPGITFAGEDQSIRLSCKPGELVMFPGWLKHSVPPFHEHSDRISISWNLGYEIRQST